MMETSNTVKHDTYFSEDQVAPQVNMPQNKSYKPAHSKKKAPLSLFAKLALIFGIVGFVFSFIPVVNLGVCLVSVAAIVFSILGFIVTKDEKKGGLAFCLVGFICAIFGIAVSIILCVFASNAFFEQYGSYSDSNKIAASEATIYNSDGTTCAITASGKEDGLPFIEVSIKNAMDNNICAVIGDIKIDGKSVDSAATKEVYSGKVDKAKLVLTGLDRDTQAKKITGSVVMFNSSGYEIVGSSTFTANIS